MAPLLRAPVSLAGRVLDMERRLVSVGTGDTSPNIWKSNMAMENPSESYMCIIYIYIYIICPIYVYIYIHINYSIINLVIDDFPTKASIYRGISMDVMGFLIAMGLGQARMAHATEEF